MIKNAFLLSRKELQKEWKDLRESLKEKSEDDQLKVVIEFWHKAPLLNYVIDPTDPTDWPTIWEMIHDGEWSEDAIAVGMEATLRLAGWSSDRLRLCYLKDSARSVSRLVLEVDKIKWLNLDYNKIVSVDSGCDYLEIICFDGKKYARKSP